MKLTTGYRKPITASLDGDNSYLLLAGGGQKALSDLVQIAGALTISGSKTFSSLIYGNISGNAGSVTDGVYASTALTITGSKTFSNPINGDILGNATTADRLKNSRTINGVAFDGSSNITITAAANGGTATSAGTATTAGSLTNLTRQSSGPSWGTLASGYTSIGHWADAGGGGMALGYKSGQMSMQIDGKFYQNEGANKVLDSADVSTSGSGWGASMTVDGKTLTIPSRPSYTQSEISPTISKKYTGLYYATAADDQSKSAFFFISARPDSWYKPWKVRFRIRSVIPAATNCDSVSWVELYGRADSVTYKIYNERYDHAHYYAVVRILKLAGFNAVNGNSKSLNLGHAIGINLLYSNSYTNATYYRNFDLDYYDSYGCTVSVLDSPVNWSGWTNNSDSYYNGYSNYDAVSRGLQETGDNDSYAYNVSPYYRYQKAGANGVYGYNIITEDTAGCLSGFVKSRSVENNKTKNNVSFKVGSPLYYNTASGETSSGSIVYGYNIRTYYSLIDFRYSVNVASGVLTAYKPLYIKGLLNTDLTSYTLPDTWWTQDLPTSEDGCVYIYLGMVYPDSLTYRISWEEYHPSYIYKNGTVRLMGGHASFAEAVKNGVYITGAQTITGNKTFSGSTTIDSLTAGNLTVNGATSLTGDTNAGKVIATSFVKSGGTSSLFLMADGSVTSGYTKNAGTVTSVATGVGLTGGTITSSGTLKAKLKNETLTTEAAIQPTYNKDRLYEVRADKDGYLSVVVPWTNVNSSYMTTSHAANGITSTNISNWNAVHTWYTTAASGDTDTLINNWNDIVRFLENTSDETTLLGLLAAKLNKAGGTVTGDLIVNGGTTLNTLSAVSLSVTGAASFSNPINGDILGNATTADRLKNARTINGVTFDGSANINITYPYGFSSFTSGVTWGDTTGTSFASWNDSTGGGIDFRRDNPSSGKMSIKVDGRVYVNEGSNPCLSAIKTSASGSTNYWGLRGPDGDDVWLRTTTNGLLPYTSGGATNGHSSIGTSSWYFSAAYILNIYGYLNGNISGSSSSCTGNAATATNGIHFLTNTTLDWKASTAYTVGLCVRHTNNYMYRCSTAHTSGSSFDSSKWTRDYVTYTATSSSLSSITTGTTIAYIIPAYGGDSYTQITVTLKDGTTTNTSRIYRNNGNTTTHLPKDTIVILVYDGTYWRWYDYDSGNDFYFYLDYAGETTGTNGVKSYSLVMRTSDDKLDSIVTSSTYETTKSVNTAKFILGSQVWYPASYSIAANTSMRNDWRTLYSSMRRLDFRYSANCGTTLTSGKPVYLVGTKTSDGYFQLDATTWWTQTIPTTADNKIYVRIGGAYDSYRIDLYEVTEWFEFSDGSFHIYSHKASTVTNGVYTTGDQTISGNKTFSGSTTIDSLTAGNLTVTGASTLTGDVSLGTVKAGTWEGGAITDAYITSANNWNSKLSYQTLTQSDYDALTVKNNNVLYIIID